MYLIISFK